MTSPSIIINPSKLCDRLVITNATVYDEDFEYEALEIKAPNNCCFEAISLTDEWCSIVVTADDLGVSCGTSGPNCLENLEDGVYEIKYTVDNQEALYYHFRVCKLWNLYLRKVCELFDTKCESTPQKFKKAMDNLHDVRDTILDAVIMAEDCLDIDKAIFLYNHAEEKLKGNGCMCN